MNPNFNLVARPYDFISRLVFGNALVESQVRLLSIIPSKSKILVVGGGTGWILEEIAKVHPAGLEITYVEVSLAMLDLSRLRQYKQNHVTFIHKPIEEYQTDAIFDVIITPFFFDLFKENKVNFLFAHIDKKLINNGLWLYTDFIPPKYQIHLWQKILLKSMYWFFGFLSQVEARKLVNMDFYFEKNYTKISENWFYARFIRSNIYQKKA